MCRIKGKRGVQRAIWRACLPGLLVLLAAPAAGQAIRRIESRRLTLYTDLPSSAAVDRLPAEFDHAVAQWTDFFGVAANQAGSWRVTACLMADRDRFRAAGLLPREVPEFRHGLATANRIWLDEQPSDYYRRHLLLHEGTHAFQEALVGASPPWHQEGVAELLATHALDAEGHVRLNVFPAKKDDVPRWGRIALVREAIDQGRLLGVEQILELGPTAHQDDEAYGWCWALAAWLDADPRYRQALRRASGDSQALRALEERLRADRQLAWRWREFVSELEFGYDLQRAWRASEAAREPVSADGDAIRVDAARGWQPAGIQLAAGRSYRLASKGRIVIASTTKDWISDAGGVSIRYHEGRPLGQLLATVVDERGDFETFAVGRESTIVPARSGELYLKVNDSPAERGENRGEFEVRIEALNASR